MLNHNVSTLNGQTKHFIYGHSYVFAGAVVYKMCYVIHICVCISIV